MAWPGARECAAGQALQGMNLGVGAWVGISAGVLFVAAVIGVVVVVVVRKRNARGQHAMSGGSEGPKLAIAPAYSSNALFTRPVIVGSSSGSQAPLRSPGAASRKAGFLTPRSKARKQAQARSAHAKRSTVVQSNP